MPFDSSWLIRWPSVQAFCSGDVRETGVAALLRLLLLAPLLEEWIVRAGLQEWLMRRPFFGPQRHAAIQAARLPAVLPAVLPIVLQLVLPALFFSALHWRAGAQVAVQVFLPGLAFGLLYRTTRDWRHCALAHALSNGAALGFCHIFV
jgi:membrane protease YdiL (CAAX protease family)